MRAFTLLLLTCLWSIFSISNRLGAHEFQSVHVYAHRGAGYEFDENTLEACVRSYAQGLRGFEVDLRMSKDQELILMHDATLKRTTGAQGSVESLAALELTRLKTLPNQAAVPRFKDLVAEFKDKHDARFLLELKTSDASVYTEEVLDVYVQRVVEAVKPLAPGSYWFTSFDARALARIKQAMPEVATGYLTGTAPTQAMIETAKALGCSRLSVALDHTSRAFVRQVKDAGLQISLYPIRSLEDAQLAVTLGSHILCTDIPSQLVKPSLKTRTP